MNEWVYKSKDQQYTNVVVLPDIYFVQVNPHEYLLLCSLQTLLVYLKLNISWDMKKSNRMQKKKQYYICTITTTFETTEYLSALRKEINKILIKHFTWGW